MRKTILFLLICLFSVSFATITYANQPLPESPWYAIVHQPETDTLHWYNAAGEQASIPRPTLENETAFLDMRIAPNGTTMFLVAEVQGGTQAIGIYDFDAGSFVQTHFAEPDENINLGGDNIFTPNSQYVAVGLFSGDFQSPAWRVILFDMVTGDVVSFIDHTHPDAPDVQLSAPAVQYVSGQVHFQLIPQSVGGAMTWPAYAWQALSFDPNQPIITESPYVQANAQVLLLTGIVASTYVDAVYPQPPPTGQFPTHNAIGVSLPTDNPTPTTVYADGTRYHFITRWARGGDWILFYSVDAQGEGYWSNVEGGNSPENNSMMPFPSQFEDVYGTSDGYLLTDDDNQLFYTNGFIPTTALNLAQLTPQSQVVYVTPIGVNFTLDNLGNGTLSGANDFQAEPTPINDCALAPPQRMTIGGNGQVITAALNVRSQPDGSVLLILNNNDVFDVLDGSICNNGLYWWQIDYNGTMGWAAEGNTEEYFMQPSDGIIPPATATPFTPPDGFAPNPTEQPTATNGFFVVPGVIITPTPVPTIGGFQNNGE
ncbi:MAG: SH3 domain-containing protein [Phototrophicaceae bacterium]